jgi:hypothetical protein
MKKFKLSDESGKILNGNLYEGILMMCDHEKDTIYFNENVNFDDDESFIDELTLQEVFFKNLNKIWKQKNL